MRERRYRALCALALALPLCALLRESLFGGKVLCQADHLLSFPPWSEVAPPGHVPGNPVLEDQSILTVPWLGFAAERIRAGELPLWNPHNYGGQPIHAVGSGAFLWPVHFLYYLFPTLGFYAWSALLRLLAAGFFMLLFLRRIGVSRTAALPGAGAFMLSGFLIAWLNHPHSNVALLVPAVLWAVERVAARPRWREAGVFGLVYGLQLLGGHLQTSLHLTLVLAAWCLFRTRVVIGGARLGGAGWGRLLTGGVLGLLRAAPQILPFLEY
ncbi:MAG: hypothetical protein O7B99_15595, partial [Planctomycetota bacterium]|nr:hypothetical protein [Planctomycetota bacterium]